MKVLKNYISNYITNDPNLKSEFVYQVQFPPKIPHLDNQFIKSVRTAFHINM